jgi:hypothetical protein
VNAALREHRQARVALIADDGDQLANIAQALRRDYSELREMRPQGIHQARALAHQPFPTTVQKQSGLLLSRLARDEAHRRPHNRLANRFCIRRVALVPLDLGLHVLRRHQPHLMPKCA